ncbi:Flp pilus assembly protein CpaB [Bordetella genomosp. 9]|uniref:Flp pilus assembly protein CpaB n=1 Tax=Bordetella genomosp. 9 TaxID=1416803 RepID=A0A1W6Z184_9BORD|nr:Flp pilus assembly protein CpaB [Bordetella genomosp. 9]ARP87127.1 Flp pilus assembly protein CpaB [Bordetella genomosp. 9]
MLDNVPQRWIMALVTVIAGLLAAWAARQHIQGRIAQIEAEARVPTVPRLVAAYDLAAGARLDEASVAVREVPAEWAHSDALAAEDFAAHAYSVLAHPLKRGDLVLAAHLAQEKAPPLSARVPEGRRAITIPVDEINSLSGMLQAGDHLDLYVSFEHGRRQITAPLLQGVLVLATGKDREDDENPSTGFSTITLDAGPEDAVKLVAARQAGRITAILRHHRDQGTSAAAARGDLADLLGIARAADTPPPAVPVLYGDRSDAGAGVAATEDAVPPDAGLFLAEVPGEVVSAGRLRGRDTSTASRGARRRP